MAVDTQIDFTDFEKEPRRWFVKQGKERELRFFLAHDDDGVIWGHIQGDELKLSGEAFSEVAIPLRTLTLQQVRLFGEAGELLIWRGDSKWHGRYLTDNGFAQEDILNETHRLWGTASDRVGKIEGFTLMQDGAQGLLHAPPLKLTPNQRAALQVRHYLEYDEQGQAYIALSRLVAVKKGDK